MSERVTWYHGSPHRVEVLKAGSTITRNRELACVFSHQPTLVSIEDDGSIRHDGAAVGYLYVIDEAVEPEDIEPHPRTTMAPGEEWLTTRPLRLRRLETTALSEDERLSEDEVSELLKRLESLR